jgi:hypothetical protein
MGRRTIRRGPGSRAISGKDFRLADELRYIQCRAAEHDARIVTVGGLAFFSTETGDAWILDPADHLAARVSRDGEPGPVSFQEDDTTFAIEWKGNYRLDGDTFVYTDLDTGRTSSILGYPSRKIADLG